MLDTARARISFGSLQSAFRALHADTAWPVPSTTFNAITSAFGPRIKLSSNAYDWHRGIDINASEGDPVVAAASGILWDVTTFDDGGLTVILRHDFGSPVIYKGRLLVHYYTLYMHLSEVSQAIRDANLAAEPHSVAASTRIGRVGHSGSAVDDHLHFEVRVGSHCSLEFQLQHPQSSCSDLGFDPHVHPMCLFSPRASDMHVALVEAPTSTADGLVEFDSDDDQPLLNRIEFRIVRKQSGVTVASHTLDFNERIGFDPTTNTRLDTVDVSRPYISPVSLGQNSRFKTSIILPSSHVKQRFGSKFHSRIAAADIWNRSVFTIW